jgi:hypothetical protein
MLKKFVKMLRLMEKSAYVIYEWYLSENEDNAAAESVAAANNDNKPSKLFYSKKSKHFLRDALPKDPSTKGKLS